MRKRSRRALIETLLSPKIPKEIAPEEMLKKLHSFEGELAQKISGFAGSMLFVYGHFVWFSVWILANHGAFAPYVQPFDPFPYGLLTMVVSLEAIFLATFIMISQNRQALIETVRHLEEAKEEEEAVEEVEDIQKDLDDIKRAIVFIQQKVSEVERSRDAKVHAPQSSPPQNKQ